jgi:hypothetical protein
MQQKDSNPKSIFHLQVLKLTEVPKLRCKCPPKIKPKKPSTSTPIEPTTSAFNHITAHNIAMTIPIECLESQKSSAGLDLNPSQLQMNKK